MGKSIMIQGTSSGAGKTIITMALCRIFADEGYKTAPFKAQNMTNNITELKNGKKIAISQYLQAVAAKAEPDARMNPVVLTRADNGTKVILNGEDYAVIDGYNYKEIKKVLRTHVEEAYQSLAGEYDIIVLEGAGSPVELNLNTEDFVNMGMAKIAGAPVLLAADIDRGGVFASVFGTVKLLREDESRYMKGIIVNRFRGEIKYFTDGREILERITGLPVAGIVPYAEIDLPEEDNLFSGREGLSGKDESEIEKIAAHIKASLDMELIHKILNRGA